jgi:ABC-2 type transport system permease protein
MTAPFLSLVRFYALSVYGPARRSAAARSARPSAKKIAKTIGIGLLALLLVADIGSIFVMMNLTMYGALKPAGLQALLLLNAATSASALVFILGFLTAISTYCMSAADSGLLAMPIEGSSLLGSKMALVYLSEFAFAFFLILVATAIYAIKEAPPADFYAGALVSALALPLVPLAAIYLLVIPLMKALRPLRSKNATIIVGSVIGMAFAILFNIYIQSATSRMGDSAWLLAHFAGPDALLARAGLAYPPAFLGWKSMTAGGLAGPGYGLANLIVGGAAVTLVALALGKTYARSLLGFDELRVKRVAATASFMERSFRRRRPLVALLLRELRLMNREPIYFINGPFIILLMPLFLALAFFTQKERLGALLTQAASFTRGPGAMLAVAAFGAFLGSSTSICSTAISRDAKTLPYLKALPLPYRSFGLAKFLHGFAFALFGSLVGGAGGAALMGLPLLESVAAFLLALAFSSFTCIAGLWLDTANPRLSWDNPTAALKQNPNSSILIVAAMAALGALGALSAALNSLPGWGRLAFFALYFTLFAGLAAAALAAYPRYAERRIGEIEN